MPARKMPLPPTQRVIDHALLLQKNNWVAQEAADWSGIEYRTLLKLLKAGLVPTIPIGKPQVHNMGKGKRRKHRACSKFIIPRVAFMRWFENIGAPGPDGIGNTAA
jgi:hypothetical protein